MRKKDLIEKLATEEGMKKDQMGRIVDAIFREISEVMVQGGRIRMNGFGTFETKDFLPRKGQNPITKEDMIIPGYRGAKFRPAQALKEKVRNGI